MSTPPRSVVRIEAKDVDALFDDRAEPVYPHTGRLLRASLAQYLELRTREQRRSPSIEVVIALRTGPLAPAEEERVREQIGTYFAEERPLADLDLRVNLVEGRGSFRFGLPMVLLALGVAGALYLAVPQLLSNRLIAFVTALAYLGFITVVWVLLWDPIEKLLFDAYFLRRRGSALEKLRTALVRFEYSDHGSPSS